MAAVESGKIRNVAVVGHRGTGKTSLIEAMLFQSGAVNRLGTVEAGSTVSDWDEDEQRRQMSLQATLCRVDWQGRKINLLRLRQERYRSQARPGVQSHQSAATLVASERLKC